MYNVKLETYKCKCIKYHFERCWLSWLERQHRLCVVWYVTHSSSGLFTNSLKFFLSITSWVHGICYEQNQNSFTNQNNLNWFPFRGTPQRHTHYLIQPYFRQSTSSSIHNRRITKSKSIIYYASVLPIAFSDMYRTLILSKPNLHSSKLIYCSKINTVRVKYC